MVRDADCIRFQWFLYGLTPSAASLRFQQYKRTDGGLEYSTDFQPEFLPNMEAALPAVQLHTGLEGA